MYVIMVYDVNVKRVRKVLKIGRKYLNWTLRSVLEGFLTKEDYEALKNEIRSIIDSENDTVYFYIIETSSRPYRILLGNAPAEFNFIE
ncbi:CRISPR-associated protein, Cas2 family [Fervidobacterium changbaicum]|uniref:CRISPR-associated endoribonuclease Cas2 n=1 Tax=Fervidobacterium changbaicum TaxID=310769 RepID=A0ABX5QRT8_9BACT|nr:CRISPR-associated endonuclease Cas2 [Fervidobacterium changbaicum]QAV33182.1 CRISPR-associated endonuclease Cas2 [Fervidobacterium changbaicum]SDH70815.1 CRISPR-associated protein, Cas2 family [Fervidobacterium changbaicum]